MISDGCTYWFNGSWEHCCQAHDLAYFTDTVTLQSHIDLGICVSQTLGGPIMGALMAAATALWWLLRHRDRRH